MTTKYTPGPWNVDPLYPRDIQANGCEISTAFDQHQQGELIRIGGKVTADFEEACANARLIAAAPELVEALRELMDDLEAEIEARRGSVLLRTTERDLAPVRKARALLARIDE
jgi:hypothetical protein